MVAVGDEFIERDQVWMGDLGQRAKFVLEG